MSEALRVTLEKADATLRLPPSAIKIYELTQKPDASTEEIVRLVQVDPTFVAKLLRLANSSTYARGAEVVSISRAILSLGFREVGQLAITLAAAKEFNKVETELLRSSSFWSHSVTTAVLAAKKARICEIDDGGIFVAALLHDLALPIQFSLCSEGMVEALDLSIMDDDISLQVAESHSLGFNHTELGAQLAEKWNLPKIIVDAIRHHHAPADAEENREAVAVIAWANAIESLGTDADDDLPLPVQETLDQANEILPLPRPKSDKLLEEAQAEAVEMLGLF